MKDFAGQLKQVLLLQQVEQQILLVNHLQRLLDNLFLLFLHVLVETLQLL